MPDIIEGKITHHIREKEYILAITHIGVKNIFNYPDQVVIKVSSKIKDPNSRPITEEEEKASVVEQLKREINN